MECFRLLASKAFLSQEKPLTQSLFYLLSAHFWPESSSLPSLSYVPSFCQTLNSILVSQLWIKSHNLFNCPPPLSWTPSLVIHKRSWSQICLIPIPSPHHWCWTLFFMLEHIGVSLVNKAEGLSLQGGSSLLWLWSAFFILSRLTHLCELIYNNDR